jgi:prevent-host-death family protein
VFIRLPQGKVDLVVTGDYFLGMRTVGVKELKARLSEYLRAVRVGETVLVTDRNEVIAELRPIRPAAPDAAEARLRALAAVGEVTRARLPKEGWTWKVEGVGLPKGTADALLHELRAEREG